MAIRQAQVIFGLCSAWFVGFCYYVNYTNWADRKRLDDGTRLEIEVYERKLAARQQQAADYAAQQEQIQNGES